MLLTLCALGALLIAAGTAVSFGTGPALITAGVLMVALAVAWDVLYAAEGDEDGE